MRVPILLSIELLAFVAYFYELQCNETVSSPSPKGTDVHTLVALNFSLGSERCFQETMVYTFMLCSGE